MKFLIGLCFQLTTELSLTRSAYFPGENIYGSVQINGKKPKNIFDQVKTNQAEY